MHCMSWWFVRCALVLAVSGCVTGGDSRDGGDGGDYDDAASVDDRGGELLSAGAWEALPAPPLSGRVGSAVAAVDGTLIVAGGWDFLCPPGASCVLSNSPPHADGAAYDLSTGQWSEISDAPVAFRTSPAAVSGNHVYVLSQCEPGPTCPAGHALLRYRSDTDEWDMLPAPDADGDHLLVAVTDGIVAYSTSDERGARPDYRFMTGDDAWTVLPDDPLAPMYDRFVVEYEGRLMLFGSPIDRGEMRTKLVAAFDPATETWEELAASGTQGYQVWLAGSLFYLNPHFGNAGGGVYDPGMDEWSPLPDPPHHDLAGIIGEDGAAYEYASGWVLDTRSGDWLEIQPRPDSLEVYDEVIAAGPTHTLVVFGGQTFSSGAGELLNDTWLWTPPAAGDSSR